jgi:hypothetical protein
MALFGVHYITIKHALGLKLISKITVTIHCKKLIFKVEILSLKTQFSFRCAIACGCVVDVVVKV